jgi:GDP-D-mannose 3', 5'-epimerase
MKILVTGCAGMIGTKLVEMLINSNIPVVGCDNFFRGERDNIDFLKKLAVRKKSIFEFHELDLLDGLPVSILEGVDTVVHLADVVGGIKYVFDNQFDVFNLNVTIDANTTRAVASSKVKKYIYAATACSFPHQLQNSVDSMLYEKDKFPADPESPYGWSKLVGELQSIFLNKIDGVECARVIFHNVYGPWCDFDLDTSQVIPALINKAYNLKSKDMLEVWGDGKQARSFINSYDIANSLLTMIKTDKPLSDYDSVQLGDKVGTTIEELSKIILSELGKDESLIKYINPDYRGDVGRIPDQTLAKKLGLVQQIGVREGIRDLIEWAKNNGKI